ncbi:MAG TPA: family 10 glycosylhydrolase [Candidatus Paceibacterota bacterium]|nr:family 10 glycosylhydrolase [Candidatus Paceibacterota bacterium]
MKLRIGILFAGLVLMPAMLFAAGVAYLPAAVTPPEPPREFRGAWLVTLAVTNVDWPSRPGLSSAQQKAELIALLDRAVELKLNAVLFQIRPMSDALYDSPIEPWSEFLTGKMGRAPKPFYDPLAFAVAEAHKRGLDLYAWMNPFRARHALSKSPVAANHISRTHPEWVRKYGDQLWLDPGEPAARDYVLRVVMDVVRRYDVDGVTFDDYFYPYPVKNAADRVVAFPDDASWRTYGVRSGMTRDNWRRANVNDFVQSVFQSIKASKPWVKFGVSPFGIWRPGYPPQIKGLDAYASLYADSRLWFANGWLDYLSPQLYWPVDSPQQSFPALLNWWSAQNTRGRGLWPALDATAVGGKFSADEIARQVQIIRRQPGAGGEIFYHLRNLSQNPVLLQTLHAAYTQPALAPASPWLSSAPPATPGLTVEESDRSHSSRLTARWRAFGDPAWKWVLQFRGTNGVWTTEILPAEQTTRPFEDATPEIISVRAVNRFGNLGPPAVLKKTMPTPPSQPR